jgi:hypothetical protein
VPAAALIFLERRHRRKTGSLPPPPRQTVNHRLVFLAVEKTGF